VQDLFASGNVYADVISANTYLNIPAPSLNALTTDDLNEGTANLYFTLARARGAYTEGQGIAISANGVISTRGSDTGLGAFNSGINLMANSFAGSSFQTVKTFPSLEGNSFIAFSIHVTNISEETAYLTGRFVFDSNNILFANLLEIPRYTSIEILQKPQIFKPDDAIEIQSFDASQTPANDVLAFYVSYQGTLDTTFNRSGITIDDNQNHLIYDTSSQISVVESINLVNLGSNVMPTTVTIVDGGDNLVTYLSSNLQIPPYSSVELCEYPKSLIDGHKIKVQKFDNPQQMSILTSSKFTSSYTINPSGLVMNEEDTLQFDILTTNILDGTILYYEIEPVTGNLTQDDFITPLEGNVVIINNGVRLSVQANADLNLDIEPDESFRLVLRKGSNTGPTVKISDTITLKDTSNTITYDSLIESGDTIVEGATISFILDTTNLGPNNTLYYTTLGNAESALFVSGNTGSFVTTGNSYTLELVTTAILPENETRFFQLEIREDSAAGPVKITSNVINVVDALQAFVSATGGSILIEDNYKIHTFTSSGELTISGLGIPAYRSIDYLVVAGGGGGGVSGGGAGGLRVGNISSTGTFTVTVGAGGVSGTQPNAPGALRFGYRGGNSSISTVFECVGGGGSGGYSNAPEINGGSGGGTGYAHPAGTGIAGQGNPGGGFWNPAIGSNREGGGGGAGSPGSTRPTSPVSPTQGAGNAIGGGGIALSFYPSVPNAIYSHGGWHVENFNVPSASTLPAGTNNGYGGNTFCRGAPGVVIIKYPYTVKTFDLTDNLLFPGAMVQGSNVIFSLRTTNTPNNSVLYYTTSGNVTTDDFFGGNTGSFTVINGNASISLSIANNIVSGGDTKAFALQIREQSTSSPVVGTANTITIYSQDPSNFIQATGGTITEANGYTIHTFTSSDTFTITNSGVFNTIEYLIIGGGGAGGFSNGNGLGAGGGGAGGYITNVSGETSGGNTSALAKISGSVPPGTSCNVIVGAGGTVSAPTGGLMGSNSSVEFPPSLINGGTKIALGGGAGGSGSTPASPSPAIGTPGGSGGGSGGHGGTQNAGGSGTIGQGFAGGGGAGPISNSGGGGAGAGGAGATAFTQPSGFYAPSGPGGTGIPSRITGFNTVRAGGGAGGHGGGGTYGTPGTGGGGSASANTAGQINTGSGGAGGSRSPSVLNGTSGGSGIVIIRYLKP
jgi:hypothetical protein